MARTHVKVSLQGGKAVTDQDGAVSLDYGDVLELNVGSGWSGHAKVSELSLYEWVDGKGQGDPVGTWSRSNPRSQPSPAVYVSPGEHHIDVKNVDISDNESYCYTATVNDSNGDHTTKDPELIVRKKSGG